MTPSVLINGATTPGLIVLLSFVFCISPYLGDCTLYKTYGLLCQNLDFLPSRDDRLGNGLLDILLDVDSLDASPLLSDPDLHNYGLGTSGR